MTDEVGVPFTTPWVATLARARERERMDVNEVGRGLWHGHLTGRLKSILSDDPERYGLDPELRARARKLYLDLPNRPADSRALSKEEEAFILDLLRGLVEQMIPTPAEHYRANIARMAKDESVGGEVRLDVTLDVLTHLDPELLDGLTEEDLMPLLTHPRGEVRSRGLTILARLEPVRDEDGRDRSTGSGRARR